MLTSAFYYNFYRPYIVGVRERSDTVYKRPRIARSSHQDKLDQGMRIVLNKSRKDEIVNYAKNVSQGVTNFKSTVHMALSNMSSFGLNAMYNGYDSALSLVEEDLTNLTTAYNISTAFLWEQNQSADLRSFSQTLRDRIYQERDRLGLLGLSLEEENEGLRFDPAALRGLTHIELHAAIGANMQVFHGLDQSTTDMLTAPMSSHMSFRGLSYHYNYQLGRMVEDGFGMIESGMIVDRVV